MTAPGRAAARGNRTFHESLRFPWPNRPVRVVLQKRQPDHSFAEAWSVAIDPASRLVNRAPLAPAGAVWTLFESGARAGKVDLVILGDGYTAEGAEHAVRLFCGELTG